MCLQACSLCVAYPVMEGSKGRGHPVLHYASIPLASSDEQHDVHRYDEWSGKGGEGTIYRKINYD